VQRAPAHTHIIRNLTNRRYLRLRPREIAQHVHRNRSVVFTQDPQNERVRARAAEARRNMRAFFTADQKKAA
jgi:hypothetical protein